MNTTLTLLFTAIFVLLCAQVFGQIYDFEDAAIPNAWQGDRSHFQVSNSNQLQLNAPVGSTASSLCWPSINAANCSWEFYLNYAFAASTTNYATLYLFSTEPDFTSANNVSYYLKIGGATGSTDKIELIYQQGLTKQVVLESRPGIVAGSQVACRIQVLKSAAGIWELKIDSAGTFNYTEEATAQHWQANAFNYSGIRCVYSSTRRDKFYFDDMLIREPFAIQGYAFENDSTLKILFNQTLDKSLLPTTTLNFNAPYAIDIDSNYLVFNFTEQIRSGRYTGTISSIFANNGDSLLNVSIPITKEFTYYVGQIRISEWMSDPSPSYGLPEVEWLELVNLSDQPVDLNNISIADPSTKVRLPAYLLNSDSVVIICHLNACSFFLNKNCIEVNALPSLNNSSDSIFVWANDTLLIDFIQYDLSSMPTDFRSDGGYSMIRKEYPEECVFSQTIDFFEDNIGGSPGTISSLPKTTAFTIQTTVLSASEVNIQMNAKVSILGTSFYASMGIMHAISNGYAYGTSYTFDLNQALETGNAYSFLLDSIHTCRNQVKRINTEIQIIYPKPIERNDVFVNEVLYNPNSGGVDFIELYNPTSKFIQLQNGHFYNQANTTLQHVFLSENKIIEPFGFVVLTSDTAILKNQYSNTASENAFQLIHFLSLPDTGGQLIWLNQNGDTLDHVCYGDAYQNPLHRNSEGYSLEKIYSSAPNFYAANWTTSAVYATPGYVNSQQMYTGTQHKPFYCNPCHVTTNLNGVNDFAVLHLGEAVQGCFGSIGIYRLSGEKVIDLIVNQSLGNTNTFQWNGQQQGGALLEDGIYVAVAEWWSSDGKTYVSKIAISTSQY